MTALDLPVVDLSTLHPHPDDPALQALGDALTRYGFVALTGHGLDLQLLNDCYVLAAELFALPGESKRRWERPELGRQRGYTGFGIEHAKDTPIGDLKEFWQVGRTLGSAHPLVSSGVMPDNVCPGDPAAFGATFARLFGAMDHVADRLLLALATYLGAPPNLLTSAVADGNSVLRVIHYPPLRSDDDPHAVRAAAHEDINLITILPVSTQPGLELVDRSTGAWRPVVTPPDVLIADTGDLMAYLTAGRLPATTHRVVNPPGSGNVARYSMPFFVHPRPDWHIVPLSGDAPPIQAGAYLEQRLRENGVL